MVHIKNFGKCMLQKLVKIAASPGESTRIRTKKCEHPALEITPYTVWS